MSMASDPSSLAKSDGPSMWGRVSMTPLKYALVVYAALLPYAYAFFYLQQADIVIWLFRISLFLFAPFVILSLVMLFRGSKKSFLIFYGTWIWIVLAVFCPM